MALAAGPLATLLAACGDDEVSGGSGTNASAGGSISMAWWGNEEAIGIDKWIDLVVKRFEEREGVQIDATELASDQVIPSFTAAAAAGKTPDVHFFWNGIYVMESVWNDYVAPLDDLLPAELLKRSNATPLSHFDGKQYRVGFYPLAFLYYYNDELLNDAGVTSTPQTWDQFLDACDKLKSKGTTPFGAGIKDGYFGEWFFGTGLTQNLDKVGDVIEMFASKDRDWREPRYTEQWIKLDQLAREGFFNDDISSLTFGQGNQLFDAGRAAIAFNASAALANSEKQLGTPFSIAQPPTWGSAAMAGRPIVTTQGFGIPAAARRPEVAARLLALMHDPEMVQEMWSVSKQLPADTEFDSSVVDDPLLKQVYDDWVAADSVPYISEVIPQLFWQDAMFVASQKIVAGAITPEQAGELCQQVTERWRKQNPEMVEDYAAWASGLADVG